MPQISLTHVSILQYDIAKKKHLKKNFWKEDFRGLKMFRIIFIVLNKIWDAIKTFQKLQKKNKPFRSKFYCLFSKFESYDCFVCAN